MRFNARFYIRIDLGVANERGWCARECTPRAAVEGMSHLPRPSFLSTIQSSGVPSTRHGDAPSCPGGGSGAWPRPLPPRRCTHTHTRIIAHSHRECLDLMLCWHRVADLLIWKLLVSRPNWLRFSPMVHAHCSLLNSISSELERSGACSVCESVPRLKRNPVARTKAMNLIYVLIYQYVWHFAVYGEMRNMHLIWVALFFFCIQSLCCLLQLYITW